MTILDIKFYPDPVLRAPTETVTDFSEDLDDLIKNMFETCKASKGVGLAAPQIGLSQKILVVDFDDQQFELINPVLSNFKGSEIASEGCLSLPGVSLDVERAYKITVEAQNKKGENIRFEVDDFVARIIQHEVDHLNGILIIDKGAT